MEEEASWGIVPIRRTDRILPLTVETSQVLLIQQKTRKSGVQWSIPKGHREEADATPRDAAQRELLEETGLEVDRFIWWHDVETLTEQYTNPERGTKKTVTYWTAELKDWPVSIQEAEVVAYRWCKWIDAIDLATFEDTKNTLRTVANHLEGGDFTH